MWLTHLPLVALSDGFHDCLIFFMKVLKFRTVLDQQSPLHGTLHLETSRTLSQQPDALVDGCVHVNSFVHLCFSV